MSLGRLVTPGMLVTVYPAAVRRDWTSRIGRCRSGHCPRTGVRSSSGRSRLAHKRVVTGHQEVTRIDHVGMLAPVQIHVMHMRAEAAVVMTRENVAHAEVADRVTLRTVTCRSYSAWVGWGVRSSGGDRLICDESRGV